MAQPDEPREGDQGGNPIWKSARAWVAGLTGVLLVMPALVNSGWDVYVAVRNLPRTSEEREQQELFRQYFDKQPLGTYEIPVKSEVGTLVYRLRIYDRHIFTQFGDRTFWFPIAAPAKHVSSWFPEAFAGEPTAQPHDRAYVIENRYEGDLFVVEQLYADGTAEKIVLDPKTGRIVRRETTSGHAPFRGGYPQDANRVIELPAIDVQSLKKRQQ